MRSITKCTPCFTVKPTSADSTYSFPPQPLEPYPPPYELPSGFSK